MVVLFHRLLKHIFPVILVLITAFICFQNFTPGTFLSGWDTLHPEFNISLNFQNLLFGVFRTDQGLGAVAAHAHMSELPRLLILWIASLVFDLSFLRYFYVFICFVLGPLGVYFLLRNIISKRQELVKNSSAFLGALFYIFNLATVQQFYVPFEMFLVQYAALGWLFLFVIRYLYSRQAKDLLILCLITFFASPMAYAFLLFYTYIAGLGLFCITLYLLDRKKIAIKHILLVFLATFVMNAFWLLPHFYFLATTAHEIPNAQTNRLFSEEAFLHNKQYGTVQDTAIFKNFLFNWTEVTTSQSLLASWKSHISNWYVVGIGYFGFIIALFGIAFAVLKRKKTALALLPVGIFSFIMIISMNPPLDFFFSHLRDLSSLFKEGLRFPYTKFSVLLIFTVSMSFAIGVSGIMNFLLHFVKGKLKNILLLLILLCTGASLLYYGKPMFEGELISPTMRIKIPNEYFEYFKYMNTKPENGRIAPLPMHSIWGWEYYDWGYMGAGFTWFGLKQAVLARDFDRWNPSNEQYYKEMSSALYSRNVQAVEKLAQKYRIGYFVLDKRIIAPGNKPNILWIYETQDLFSRSPSIRLDKVFNNSIFVYKVDLLKDTKTYIHVPTHITSVAPEISGGYTDSAFEELGDYYYSEQAQVVYPSRTLLDRYGLIDPQKITLDNNTLLIKLSSTLSDNYVLDHEWLDTSIYPDTLLQQKKILGPEINSLPYRVGDDFYLSVPLAGSKPALLNSLIYNPDCSTNIKPLVSRLVVQVQFVSFSSVQGELCSYYLFPEQSHDLGNLVVIEARNLSGLPLRICITDNISKRCDVYTALKNKRDWHKYYFVVPPLPTGSKGYAVHFDNISIGEIASKNDLAQIQVISLPYYRLERIRLFKDGNKNIESNNVSVTNIEPLNPNVYRLNAQTGSSPNIIELSKAYDLGWKAYSFKFQTPNSKFQNLLIRTFPFVFGEEIKEHVRINNWANGWLLPENSKMKIIIIYLPGYLEQLGIIMLTLFLPLFYIFSRKHHVSTKSN